MPQTAAPADDGEALPLSLLQEHCQPSGGISLGDHLGELIVQRTQVKTLLDCLPSTSAPVIYSPDARQPPLRHHELRSFVANFVLPHSPTRPALGPNDRVVIALPTGPENAVALLALATYHACAPINASATAAELRDDAQRLGAKAIVTTPDANERLDLKQLQESLDCEVIFIIPRCGGTAAGLFDMTVMGTTSAEYPPRTSSLHGLTDISLVLFTSGTGGRKKIVPYPLKTLIVGTACVIHSWGLEPSDINLNMMPLFHVGGIVRNLLAPVLSGESAIMCFIFDPIAFWNVASLLGATWYYAAPTIHHAVLLAKPNDPPKLDELKIRMVCNAAGGLLPSLAAELKEIFPNAVVLPSCMPIATPPQNYQLDRPGCSGVACGPYISIRDPGDVENELPVGQQGSICVRGLPTFDGYEVSSETTVSLDASEFSGEGWFDSGDLGYMDADGYLYVTGRSKEIINRGGEVISPSEIEEAVSTCAKGYIKNALVFSVAHDVLQETVGLVIVPADDRPRIGLHQLNELLQGRLHPSKWPFIVVYMDDIPKNSAGKPLRIQLGTRLGFERFSHSVSVRQRHFEAQVPLTTASLSDPIPCHVISIDSNAIEQAIRSLPGVVDTCLRSLQDGSISAYLSLDPGDVTTLSLENVKHSISQSLPGYWVPDAIFTLFCPLHRHPTGELDFDSIEADVSRRNASGMAPTEIQVRDIVAQMLLLEPGIMTRDSDFFLLGGNSLLLGKLSYLIRKQLGTTIGAADLFAHSTIAGIASLLGAEGSNPQNVIKTKQSTLSASTIKINFEGKYMASTLSALTAVHEHNIPTLDGETYTEPDRPRRRGQNHPISLIVQAVPFILFYPLKMALAWSMLLFVLSYLAQPLHRTYWSRMAGLISAIVIARFISRVVCPLTAIAFKWLVIGKYKPGSYRTWSSYYLRWWIVNQSIRTAGKGIFSAHPALTILYYRLLGAKIGRNVHIDPSARLGEYDLITLQNGCRIDSALVRGFCVERGGYIRLERIVIGERAVVNTYTTISPGAIIPDGSVYGPHASSHDLPSPRSYAAYNRTVFAKPHWLLQAIFGYPIVATVILLSYTPWFMCIWLMIRETFVDSRGFNAVESVILWFSSPQRVLFHFCGRMIHVVLRPLLRLFLGILVKRCMGLNKECKAKDATQFILFRRYLNSVILSHGALKSAFSILGTHYETVSIVYRLMGAKIGQRVYWPGSGIYCLDPELLEIGDDVVFGSRSELHTTDGLGSAKIIVDNGAMIADRVVLLPGTRVGKRTVMGSGSLGRPNMELDDDGSIWMGNGMGKAVRLDRGPKEANTSSEDMVTPFGRAFYKRQAPYFVFPYSLILVIHILSAIFTVAFWSVNAVVAAQILRTVVLAEPNSPLFRGWYRYGTLYGMIAGSFIVVLNFQGILSILWVIATKWIIIGRRRDGQYDWDKSNYCQRWQLHLVLSRILYKGYGIGGVLSSLTGTAYFVWYLRALGARIGRNCGINVGGWMGIMTEPDLVELGDEVNLDNCSVVAHINSRGNFSLNSLKIGDGCALRAGSRLLSGASMENNSMLCEHTLIASGEVAEEGAVYVGWPGKKVEPEKDWSKSDVTSLKEAQASMFICHLCRHIPKDCTVTDCGHLFCEGCIVACVKQTGKCPVCIEPLSKRRLTKLQLASAVVE